MDFFYNVLKIFLLLIWLHWILVAVCGIQFPDQGSNPGPLHWEHRVLATGPPGKFPPFGSLKKICTSISLLRFSGFVLFFFIQSVCAQSCPTATAWTIDRFLCPWDFPGKNIGMSCHFLLQGIFLTQGSNLHLLHQQVVPQYLPPGKKTHRAYEC